VKAEGTSDVMDVLLCWILKVGVCGGCFVRRGYLMIFICHCCRRKMFEICATTKIGRKKEAASRWVFYLFL
jgi:hypothetical protein